MTKQRLYWLCQIGGWILYFFNEIVGYVIQFGYDWHWLLNGFINIVFCVILTHFFRILIKKYNWVDKPLPFLIARLLVSIFGITFLLVLLNIPLDSLVIGNVLADNPLLFIEYMITLAKPLLIWTSIYVSFHYFSKSKDEEVERIKLKAFIKEAEAKVLRDQMNPHFVFNALNSIRALVIEDPQKAQQGITQLSNILRSALLADRRKTVSLKEELKTIEDYLALEKVRYEERLQIKWDIAPETLKVEVPPMMLQTLVENAIKHGVQKALTWGFVSIQTKIEAKKLLIKIRNTGELKQNEKKVSDTKPGGYGLRNTAQRLELLFGNAGFFKIYQEDKLTVCAEIVVPLENTID